jgi:hypothetical protein
VIRSPLSAEGWVSNHGPRTTDNGPRPVLIGPVFPYRAGIAYCTTRLAEELGAEVISFKRQFPKSLYPGSSDIDESPV